MAPKQITVSDLPTATAQEVFDFVAYSLLKQGKKSLTPRRPGIDPVFMYREGSLRYAAGFLIPDDLYSPVMENIAPNQHSGLITSLQNIHDNYDAIEWKAELYSLAYKRNLEAKILNQF